MRTVLLDTWTTILKNVSKILSTCDGEHILLHKRQHIGQTCTDGGGSNESFCTTAEGLCAQGERHSLRLWACLTSFHPVGTQPSAAKLQETVIQLSPEIHLPRAQASQLASVGISFSCSRMAVKYPCFSDTLIERGEKLVTWDWRNLTGAVTGNISTSSRFVPSQTFIFPYCEKYIYQI